MRSFRNNNNRRPRFRSNERNFKRNGEGQNFTSDLSNSSFQRKAPGRNNHNAAQLIEKYSDLAREALSHEDKILSENYLQHADHYFRILSEQEKNKVAQPNNSIIEKKIISKPETVNNPSEKKIVETNQNIKEQEVKL